MSANSDPILNSRNLTKIPTSKLLNQPPLLITIIINKTKMKVLKPI